MFPSMYSSLEDRIARFNFNTELTAKIKSAKRCFIVGMGPSLAKIDPDALKDELVIGVNFILRTDIRPDIICISDPTRVDERINVSSAKIITVRHVMEAKRSILEKSDVYSNIEFLPFNKFNVLQISSYPEEFDKIYCGGTVIGDICLPFISYLGIPDIYIIGMDGFAGSFPQSHVWGNDSAPHIDDRWIVGTARLNRKAGQLAEKAGCSVFNLTPGSAVSSFKRVDILDLMPTLVRKEMTKSVIGKKIVFRGEVLNVLPSQLEEGAVSLKNENTGLMLRHQSSCVFLDKPSDSDLFKQDSSFYAEPSFINKEWISLRSVNILKSYVTRQNERSGFFLRRSDQEFSAYFSSFRLFDNENDAENRMETDRMLAYLEQMRLSIGNMMVRNDRLP